jgi:fatty-acid desaturase
VINTAEIGAKTNRETRYKRYSKVDLTRIKVSRAATAADLDMVDQLSEAGFARITTQDAARCFLWAGCVRVTTLHEITRAVNSFGHMFGQKERGARDESDHPGDARGLPTTYGSGCRRAIARSVRPFFSGARQPLSM